MAKRKKSSKKYYYAFVAVVLIIVLAVTLLDYKFRFGIVNWDQIISSSESESESFVYTGENKDKTKNVDEFGNLTITFIDVGQGDAILIRFPDGTNMLVDSGDSGNGDELDKHLTVNGQKLGLDFVVATHSDADHIGSISHVYDNYNVKYTFRPYAKSTFSNTQFDGAYNNGVALISSKTYANFLTKIIDENCGWEYFTDSSDFTYQYVKQNESIDLKVDFFMPYVQSVEDYQQFGNDANEISAIIMIEYAGVKILLTGDIENDAENALVACFEKEGVNSNLADCSILKVAHHGSDSSSQASFINLVKPEYSVISCGIGNKYNHPSGDILDFLFANSTVLRTDLQGDITFTITPDGDIEKSTQYTCFNNLLFYDPSDVELSSMAETIKNYKEQNS